MFGASYTLPYIRSSTLSMVIFSSPESVYALSVYTRTAQTLRLTIRLQPLAEEKMTPKVSMAGPFVGWGSL